MEREPEGTRIPGSKMIRAYCPECGEAYRVTFATWILHIDHGFDLPLCSDCDDVREHNYAEPRRTKRMPE